MPAAPKLTDETAAAIARAGTRRGTLERLTQFGMTLTEAVVEIATGAAAGGEGLRQDPSQAFAKLSRAVRMSLALETRLDELILALRNGELPSLGRAGGGGRRAALKPESAPAETGDNSQCPLRDPIQLAVWGAIDQTAAVEDEALHRFDRLYERLFESGEYDRLNLDDFDGAVRSICADLGVEPTGPCGGPAPAFARSRALPAAGAPVGAGRLNRRRRAACASSPIRPCPRRWERWPAPGRSSLGHPQILGSRSWTGSTMF